MNLLRMHDRTRFSRQIRRKYAAYNQRLSGLRKKWIRNRNFANLLKNYKSQQQQQQQQQPIYPVIRKTRSIQDDTIVDQEPKLSDSVIVIANNSQDKVELNQHVTSNAVAAITVHKIAIRPSVLILKDGNVHARIHYVMQLHKELTEQYRLILEVRINPEFPPLYIGVIQNVCDYWPANVPQSKCSLKRPRFYQKNTMCFCNMPPGIYRQRVKLNLTNILDELELPRFLVSFLFTDKKLDVHITVKLEMENKDLVGCMKLKLPLQFIST
ncbi:unnamed protein product [Heterobilharzia americana]|nr:unnamed protein product [Heterobilharzia americana]